VTATVTNTGSRSGADVAQLYVTDPAADGQPPRQLEGFQRVSLQPGQSAKVTFALTQQSLQHWDASTNAWATSAGDYGIAVGDADSASSLPLSGTMSVSAAQIGSPVTMTNPGPQEGLTGTAVHLRIAATGATSFTANGLPAGLAISADGSITGTPTTAGTTTVDVTARDANGARATASFLWSVE
jgi:beta-glucosidase